MHLLTEWEGHMGKYWFKSMHPVWPSPSQSSTISSYDDFEDC